MAPETVAALIAGIFSLVTGIAIGYKELLIQWFTRSERSIAGTWKGTSSDVEIPKRLKYKFPLDYEIRCTFTQKGISATGQAIVESDRTSIIELRGKLVRGDCFIGQFKNKNKNAFDQGSFFLRLAGTGETLEGFFMGIRMREDGMALAHITLHLQK